MSKAPEFDLAIAHKYFSAKCFNQAWDLIEKPNRTPDDDRLMVALNQASMYHWRQREDYNDQRRSVGTWQASRIHALLGNAPEALRWAEVSLSYCGDVKPFYRGYAHEALARAHALAGSKQQAEHHLKLAQDLAAQIGDQGERELLSKDLEQLQKQVFNAVPK